MILHVSREELATQLAAASDMRVSFDGRIAVIEPGTRTDVASLLEFCRKECALVVTLLQSSGAVLFRGFEILGAQGHDCVAIDALGLVPVYGKVEDATPEEKAFSARAKRARDGDVFNLPPPDVRMQGPHIELGWRSRRPRYISFSCKTAPSKAGETALFDMAAAYHALDSNLKKHFDGCTSVYPAMGEKFAIDSVLIHPQTGKRCVVLWYYQKPLANYAVVAYKKSSHFRASAVQTTLPYEASMHRKLRHEFVDGNGHRFSLSHVETQTLMDCLYANAQYVSWKTKDLLFIDNIALAHGRMPSIPPREMLAGYWNEEDIREYSANPELRADDCPPVARAHEHYSFGYRLRLTLDYLRDRISI